LVFIPYVEKMHGTKSFKKKSKSKFATTVWFPYKQNEGISVPKDRVIGICRRHGHEAAYLPYLHDREMVGPTLQSSLPMKEDNLITTEGKRCCGHSVKEDNYTACIGNSLVFIPLCWSTTVYPVTHYIFHIWVYDRVICYTSSFPSFFFT